MTPESKPDRAWGFWQESAACLERMTDAMQLLAGFVADGHQLPEGQVRKVRRDLAAFNEKFALMLREQKRKAVR